MDNLMDTVRTLAQQVAERVVVQEGEGHAIVRMMRPTREKRTLISENPGTRTGDLVTTNFIFDNETKVLVGFLEGTGDLQACAITARPEALVHGVWESDEKLPFLRHHVPPEELQAFSAEMMMGVSHEE
jgi:hypothetical protein